MDISLCMIVKNEENNIKKSIESVKTAVDEIIVVDTGSVDNTIDIAKKLGAQVYKFKWINDFSAAKNFAISKASGKWIIFLDADEYFEEESAEHVRSYIEIFNKKGCNIIKNNLINIDTSTDEIISEGQTIRIFKNSKNIIYAGKIHEEIVMRNGSSRIFGECNLKIYHTGYTEKVVMKKEKFDRNYNILLEELNKNPDDSNIHFYIAETLRLKKKYEAAYDHIKKAIEINNGTLLGIKERSYYYKLNFMILLGYSREEIISAYKECIKINSNYPDFEVEIANYFSANKNYDMAVKHFILCIKKIESYKEQIESNVVFKKREIGLCLANIYIMHNDEENYVKTLTKMLRENKYDKEILIKLFSILNLHEKSEDMYNFFKKVYDFNIFKDKALLLKVSEFYNNQELCSLLYNNLNFMEKDVYGDMKKQIKLSIAMMIKNEEEHLDECLASLKPLLDNIDSELIIVDTGSNDRSVEIARKYTNKVYFHKWNNDFSQIRNITIKYSAGEWILIIDGDEILEDAEPIINFLQQSKNYNSTSINVKNLKFKNNYENYSLEPGLRLFKKDSEFRYEGKVHNQPIYKGPVYNLNTSILHYGYILNNEKAKDKKFNRTAGILKNELEKNNKNIYYLFQLGNSYSMHDENEKALESFEKAYNLLKTQEDKVENRYIYLPYIAMLYKFDKFDTAVDIALEGINLYHEETISVTDLYYYLGITEMQNNKVEDTIRYLSKYFELIEKIKNNTIKQDISEQCYTIGLQLNANYNLAKAYALHGEKNKFLKYIYKVTDCGFLKLVLMDLFDIFLNNGYYSELLKYYNDILKLELDINVDLFLKIIDSKKDIMLNYYDVKRKFKIYFNRNYISDEFEGYKIQVKGTIRNLIEKKDLYNAESIIKEYEDIVPFDPEIQELKSRLSLLRN